MEGIRSSELVMTPVMIVFFGLPAEPDLTAASRGPNSGSQRSYPSDEEKRCRSLGAREGGSGWDAGSKGRKVEVMTCQGGLVI